MVCKTKKMSNAAGKTTKGIQERRFTAPSSSSILELAKYVLSCMTSSRMARLEQGHKSLRIGSVWLVLMALLLQVVGTSAQSLRITQASLTADGFPQITFTTSSSYYYVLYRSVIVTNQFAAVKMAVGQNGSVTLVDGSIQGGTLF